MEKVRTESKGNGKTVIKQKINEARKKNKGIRRRYLGNNKKKNIYKAKKSN